MNENKNTRLILLVLAGALLVGGVNIWQNAQLKKQEEITEQMPYRPAHRQPRKKTSPITLTQKNSSSPLVRDSKSNQESDQLQKPVAAPPSVPVKIEATQRPQALESARKDSGRNDPFKGITGYKPFPSSLAALDEENERLSQKSRRRLVPPPPPVVQSYSPPALTDSELPEPPARPLISQKVKLVGIVADHAMLKITDYRLRQDNHWPAVLNLAPGDKFESIEVVGISNNSVTLEEDGERLVKTLERIR